MLGRLKNKCDKTSQMFSLKDSNKIKSKFGEFIHFKSLFTFEQSKVNSHVGMGSLVLRCRQVWCYWRIWKVFILLICSVSSERFYHICFLIDLAFGKWQYFIWSLPLSLCKLMVLGPCSLCLKWSSDFDFNRRFGCKIFYSLCDWHCDVTTNCLTMRWRPLVANLNFVFPQGLFFHPVDCY